MQCALRRPAALATAGLTLLLAAACGGGGGSDATAGTAPYVTQPYTAAALQRRLDVPYATRPNEGGAQFTSDARKDLELGSATLTLLLDVVVPPNANPTSAGASPQPLLVWVHGGGLVAGSKDVLMPFMEGYARAGYVVAAINYRLTPALATTPTLRTRATTQATEDLMNAIRFLRVNAASYGIDTTRTATIAYSSGGVPALVHAVEFDTLADTVSDFPGQTARTDATITTGPSLLRPVWSDADALLHYDASDTPVLWMHARPTDGTTGATWQDHVVPTADRMNAQGGGCTLVEQADGSHIADLSFGGPMFPVMHTFLAARLRLGAVAR